MQKLTLEAQLGKTIIPPLIRVVEGERRRKSVDVLAAEDFVEIFSETHVVIGALSHPGTAPKVGQLGLKEAFCEWIWRLGNGGLHATWDFPFGVSLMWWLK